jgi:hypothetical protein
MVMTGWRMETDLARDPGKDIGIHVRRLAHACPIAGKQQPLFQIRAQQGSSDNRRFCLHGGRPTRRTCRSPDAVKKLNRRSFHIHLRGFFSSITPQVAAAVIPASATSSKTSSGVPIGVILAYSRSIDHRKRASRSQSNPVNCCFLNKPEFLGQTDCRWHGKKQRCDLRVNEY